MTCAMSDITFLEALATKRQEHLNALAIVADTDTTKHISIKGQIKGLDEAAAMFKADRKIDHAGEGDKE